MSSFLKSVSLLAPGRNSSFAAARRTRAATNSARKFTVTSRMMQPAKAPIVVPARGKHTATVVMLHGLGDTGDGWSDAASQLAQDHVKFIFPTAALRPIALNGGMRMTGWFDLTSLDDIDLEEDRAGIEDSASYINSLIEKEEQAGIDSSRIVVAGFSQGGAIALHTGLRREKALAGIVALSTWLPLNKDYPAACTAAAKSTPVLMCHGTYDQVVKETYGQRSAELIQKQLGMTVDYKRYPMPHSALPEELRDIRNWLGDKLPSK